MEMNLNSPLCGDDLEKAFARKSEGVKGRSPLADDTKSSEEEMAFEQHRFGYQDIYRFHSTHVLISEPRDAF